MPRKKISPLDLSKTHLEIIITNEMLFPGKKKGKQEHYKQAVQEAKENGEEISPLSSHLVRTIKNELVTTYATNDYKTILEQVKQEKQPETTIASYTSPIQKQLNTDINDIREQYHKLVASVTTYQQEQARIFSMLAQYKELAPEGDLNVFKLSAEEQHALKEIINDMDTQKVQGLKHNNIFVLPSSFEYVTAFLPLFTKDVALSKETIVSNFYDAIYTAFQDLCHPESAQEMTEENGIATVVMPTSVMAGVSNTKNMEDLISEFIKPELYTPFVDEFNVHISVYDPYA